MEHAQSDDDESDDEEDSEGRVLLKKLDGSEVKGEDGLSKRAALFFDQDIFAGIDEEEEEGEEEDEADDTFTGFDSEGEDEVEGEAGDVEMGDADAVKVDDEEEEEEEGIEFVKTQKEENWDADDEPMKNGRPGIFTIAHSLITTTNKSQTSISSLPKPCLSPNSSSQDKRPNTTSSTMVSTNGHSEIATASPNGFSTAKINTPSPSNPSLPLVPRPSRKRCARSTPDLSRR